MTTKKWFRKRRWWLLAGLVALVLAIAQPVWSLYSIARGIRSGAPLHVHPVVALTYDDGPRLPETLDLLAVLEKEEVPATFFQTGRDIEKYPDVVKKVAAAGHEIGNHSYSHQEMVWRSPAFIESELARTDQALVDLGIPKPKLMRPPFGKRLLILPWYLWLRRQSLILWAVDSSDYLDGITAAQITERVLAQIKTGPTGPIVLMHDGGGDRHQTVLATQEIITRLKAEGYTFLTVSDLLSISATTG